MDERGGRYEEVGSTTRLWVDGDGKQKQGNYYNEEGSTRSGGEGGIHLP